MFSSTHLGEVMETSCDQCKSRFRLTEKQLQQAYGHVRCGECGATFNESDAARNSNLSLHEAMYGSERRSLFSAGPLTWFIAILLLAAVGIAQGIYYKRYQLVENPRYQQQVINLCQMLPCEQSQFSSTGQIRLLERNIFTHPVASNALMVTGSFVNQAPFAQKMPELLISLAIWAGGLLIVTGLYKIALEERGQIRA